MKYLILTALLTLLASVLAPAGDQLEPGSKAPDLAQLQKMTARFAPTELNVDVAKLSAGDRKALVKLIEAARVIDDIFMTQYWSGDLALYAKLQQDHSPLGRARLHYFWINKSPWSELDSNTAFIPGVPEHKLPGANFYPETMTKEQFENWVKGLPEKQQEQAKGFFTILTADGKGGFNIVPYSEAYKANLTRCADLLKEAAALTDNATLQRFLSTRAEAFLANDYYASDVAWMDLDAPLDITIGPYETYNDELFGYKASYEAYVNLRDDQESAKLSAFAGGLQQIEDNLPIDAKYRNPKIGAQAPIRVVNEVMSAGDGAHGVQTAAYNLPNDERVIQEKGSKRVMLKNVSQAKFDRTLIPIAKRVLAKDEQGRRQLRFVLHPHRDPRVVPRPGAAPDYGGWQADDAPRAVEGTLQRDRRGESRCDGTVRAAIHVRPRAGDGADGNPGADRQVGEAALYHVSGIGVPLAALRLARGAWQRHGDAGELPDGQGRLRGAQGWDVCRGLRED